eukprot:4677429-Prymnesium_polylepis.1
MLRHKAVPGRYAAQRCLWHEARGATGNFHLGDAEINLTLRDMTETWPRYGRVATEIDITGRSGEILGPSKRNGNRRSFRA